MRVPEKERIDQESDEDLDHDLDTEGRDSQQPGAYIEILPQQQNHTAGTQDQKQTNGQGLQTKDSPICLDFKFESYPNVRRFVVCSTC